MTHFFLAIFPTLLKPLKIVYGVAGRVGRMELAHRSPHGLLEERNAFQVFETLQRMDGCDFLFVGRPFFVEEHINLQAHPSLPVGATQSRNAWLEERLDTLLFVQN